MTSTTVALPLPLVPPDPLPLIARAPGTIAPHSTFVGPGRTLHELYSSLGNVAERHANRAAHNLGLGPAAVAERIRLSFGDGEAREESLAQLTSATPRKLEKDCARLVKYASPSEALSTQLEAFQCLVELATRYIGLRHIMCPCVDPQSVGLGEDDLAQSWQRDEAISDLRWNFARNLAAACLADRDLSSLVEGAPPAELGSVLVPSAGISIIERLLVASDCEGASKYSQPLAIRYLGGILELPSFWRQSGPVYRGVVQKLLARSTILLKDLNLDALEPGESMPEEPECDTEGVDIFCEALLVGILTWLPGEKAQTNDETWYPSLYALLQLLRQPRCEDVLPKAAYIAMSSDFRALVATVPECIIEETSEAIIDGEAIPATPEPKKFRWWRRRRDRIPKQAEPEVEAITPADTTAELKAKVLLLGNGESGKSTLLKQMRMIYNLPFSSSEIEHWRQIIFDNMTRGMHYIMEELIDRGLEVPIAHRLEAALMEELYDIGEDEPFQMDYVNAFHTLWNVPVIRAAVQDAMGECAFPENLAYFSAMVNELRASQLYAPTMDDIMHLRIRTVGITETTFRVDGMETAVFDVGGAKSERRKWIHVFDDVTIIILTVGLTGYNRCLIEDRDANQMQDSMAIWDALCHSKWFKPNTAMVLCFTKNDLFEEQVMTSDIIDFFPDFNGPRRDAAAGRKYFGRRFHRLATKAGRIPDRDTFFHVASPTNNQEMRQFMKSVGIIMRERQQASSALKSRLAHLWQV
ncbi:G-protein alpha subunit-domain-containing protein [Roridomyces roridus]|uniref:G-protein alpha subunit-domain-containing protein n=1 Tax=Roridomyces roridus TaxID=1738132 RepID=A0AAD7FKI5_9AGAR|nr:G-protein alpha subunit-domain-containing protein [Roridomyces roridus]